MSAASERLAELRAQQSAPVVSPALARLNELRAAQQPEPSFLESAIETITGAERRAALPEDVRDLPELGAGLSAIGTGDFAKDLRISAGLLSSFDPEAQKDIIRKTIPDVKIEEFNGTTVIELPNGQRSVLNAPGLSQADITTGIAQALAFITPARIAGLGRTLLQRIGIGAAGAGATEAALQATTQALGSEQPLDRGQIALAAALGPAAELGTAAVTGGRRLLEATKANIPEQVARVLEQGRVFTSDLFTPTGFVGANLQRLAEKIPVIGTGGLRSAQQQERQQAIRDIAGEFDVDINTPFEEEIISSATRVFNVAQEKAVKFRNQATEELNKGGNVSTVNSLEAVNKQISRQENLGALADQPLLKMLNSVKQELSGDFQRIGQVRTTIHNAITDIGRNVGVLTSGADAALNSVRTALTQDMKNFARDFSRTAREAGDKAGGKAFAQWNASNRIFSDGFQKAKDTALKRVLTKGQATPEVVLTTIRGGKPSDLNRLNANIDATGKQAVRQTIIRDALEKSGGIDDINPTKFINELNRPNTKKAINVFFKGKVGKEFKGFREFLDLTRRAQEAGVITPTGQELLTPGAIIVAIAKPITAIGVGAPIAAGARLFESPQVRNLLIKLSDTTSKEGKEKLIRQLQPLILEESRRARTEER